MDKELSQLNYELILDAYTRHLEVISSLIYKDKVWERDDD